MMLSEQLLSDLHEAVRNHDTVKISAIRALRAAIERMEQDHKNPKSQSYNKPIEDIDYVLAAKKEMSQQQEEYEAFKNAGRDDRASELLAIITIMKTYLPAELTREDIVDGVQEILDSQVDHAFKIIMPLAAKKFKGLADGKVVSEIVREMLAGSDEDVL